MSFFKKVFGFLQSNKTILLSQDDIGTFGFFDSMSYPYEDSYKESGKRIVQHFGPLLQVQYLSHYPKFEINFVFENVTVYSGPRGDQYDINFLSLGYVGEGPRYSKYFLEGMGLTLSDTEIKAISPGAIIKKVGSKAVINYPDDPEKQKALASEVYITVLLEALGEENVEKVEELLLQHSLDLDSVNHNNRACGDDDFSAFCFAVHKNNIDLVKCLLKHGANIDAQGASGGWATALYVTATDKNLGMAEFLLKKGAKLDVGHSPLKRSISDIRFVELFLKNGAPVGVEETNYSKGTPLHGAYDPTIIKLLIQAGSDINKTDYHRCTPLHLASIYDELSAVEILLESGADPFIGKDDRGTGGKENTLPYDYAKSPEMKKLLKSYMEK